MYIKMKIASACVVHTIKKQIGKVVLLFLFFNLAVVSYSQTGDSIKNVNHFSGVVTLTNNGISVIPSFSLGEPALMFELSIGGEKFSIDPHLRFALEGKPWSFVFWARYKIVNNKKFQFRVGAHPAYLFSTGTYAENGAPVEVIKTRRYLAGELAPVFVVSKKIKLMPYMIKGHGFDPGVRNSTYLTFISSFSDLGITETIRASIVPQIFFLKMDKDHGYYFASSFSVTHKKYPLSVATLMNKKLKSDVPSKNFIWNLSLVYTFDNTYRKL